MSKYILEIKKFKIQIKGQKSSIVKNLSLNVGHGEIVGLVGESGAGKSISVLSVLNLLNKSNKFIKEGEINFYKNSNYINLIHAEKQILQKIRSENIGMIFQEPMTALNPIVTCGEQVLESIINQKINSQAKTNSFLLVSVVNQLIRTIKIISFSLFKIPYIKTSLYKDAKKETIFWFDKLKIKNSKKIFKSYPHEISGGQKQRVLIAMALSKNPDLLLADEPTTALDSFTQNAIIQDLKFLQKEQNLSILFVSHDLELMAKFTDRIYVMQNGSIVEKGDTNLVFKNPNHPYTRELIASKPPINYKLKELPTRKHFMGFDEEGFLGDINLSIDELNKKLIYPADESIKKANDLGNKKPVLKVQNVSKEYKLKGTKKNFKALNNVSFNLFLNETLGIIGESGCGKTTIGKLILKLIPISSGSIIYNGNDIFKLKRKALNSIRKDIQIVFQDPYSSLNPKQKIFAALMEPLKVHGKLSRWEQREKILTLIDEVGLRPNVLEKFPHELSGGQRQRICIARALVVNPKIIVFDESVSALDVSIQADVLNLLNKIKKQKKLTYIFISHDLSVIRFMCDRIMIMKSGEIIEIGPSEEIFNRPKSTYTNELFSLVLDS
ncbi:MAG: ABC transporter ATP-binding protein [Crocinitomicaceae bacterium]|nr:ABC transporter ATP-binding protein [Crocinitomicaceae bacterium]